MLTVAQHKNASSVLNGPSGPGLPIWTGKISVAVMLVQGESVCVSRKMFSFDYLICEQVIEILRKKIMMIRMLVLFGSESGVKQFKKMYLMLYQRI